MVIKGKNVKSSVIVKAAIAFLAIFLVLDCNCSLFFFDKLFATKSRLKSSFQGKRVWITGASSGIGTEFAKQLNEAGAHIVLSARRREKLEEVVAKTGLNPETTTIVPFDIKGSIEEIQNAVDSALKDGSIDILVLNAGVFQERPALKTPIHETIDLMKVNFEGPVHISSELIKRDKWEEKRKGHIMVMSSRFGKIPGPLSSSYCATKYALHGYFSSLDVENPWLRVNFALPGPVATNLYKDAKKQTGKESFYGSWDRQMMTPERVAKLVLSGMSGPERLFNEMWISKPFLLFGYYQNQMFPLWASSTHATFGKFAMSCHEFGFDHCLKFW